jgi:hypothetical protein
MAALAAQTQNCNAGERALGGGFNTTTVNRTVQTNGPSPTSGTPVGWTVLLNGNNSTGTLTIYVVCAS